MANHLYHFSDSAHLPHILNDGELRPNANRVSAFPLHFLWATSNDKASKTAMAFTADAERAFAEGAMRRVRLTLPAGAFERWPGILAKVPTWEAHHTRQLEERARSYGEDPFSWRCRLTPFPLADVVAVHTQSCYSPTWEPFDLQAQTYEVSDDGTLAVRIGNQIFMSKQIALPDGRIAYAAGDPIPVDAFTTGTAETDKAALATIEQLTRGAT